MIVLQKGFTGVKVPAAVSCKAFFAFMVRNNEVAAPQSLRRLVQRKCINIAVVTKRIRRGMHWHQAMFCRLDLLLMLP